jgi:hypothetical protein
MKRLTLALAAAALIFSTLATAAAAAETKLLPDSYRLPSNGDKPADLDLDGYDTSTLTAPLLRGADRFQAKWQLDAVGASNLVRDQNGNLYFTDGSKTLYSVSETGAVNWSVPLKDMEWFPKLKVGRDNRIYALTDGDPLKEEAKQGAVFAFDTAGKLQWHAAIAKVREYVKFDVDSAGNVIVATDDGIVSIHPDGKRNWVNDSILKLTDVAYDTYKWTRDNIASIQTDPDGNSFVMTNDKQLHALDSTGVEKWTRNLDTFNFDQNHLYFPGGNQLFWVDEAGVHAYDSLTGKPLAKAVISQNNLDQSGVPNDEDGGLYVNYDSNGIEKVDQEGHLLWKYRTPDRQYGRAHELVSDRYGNLYFADNGGNVISLDRQGKERYMLIRNDSAMTSVSLSASGRGDLFCLMENLGLFSIQASTAPIRIDLNGQEQYYGQEPVIVNGTTLVPMRGLFEALGADVKWDDATQSVTGTKDRHIVELQIGGKSALVDGRIVALEAEPALIDSRTMIPLRVVAEAFGATITWDGANRAISIQTK